MNLEHFGQIMVPLEEYHTLQIDKDQFVYMQIEALGMLYNHLYLFQVCQALVCVRVWCVHFLAGQFSFILLCIKFLLG